MQLLLSYLKTMGSGSSLMGPVKWYSPNSQDSLKWQSSDSGFGIGRRKSFSVGCAGPDYGNRVGNEHGQLAGKVIFYRYAKPDTNYGDFPIEPKIELKPKRKLFAKVFLPLPLSRFPVGENNIAVTQKEYHSKGAVLLGCQPRVIAIFLNVDGQPQKREEVCVQSVVTAMRHMKHMDPKPLILKRAIPDSFLSYMVSRQQDDFHFIHLPLIATYDDSKFDTGPYATTLIRTFCELLNSLEPGQHILDFKIKCYYDHCDFSYFPLDQNGNSHGKWFKGLTNSSLSQPHPTPQALTEGFVLARGRITLEVPTMFSNMVAELLDRRVPREIYSGQDAIELRRIAKIVAAGKFCEKFQLEGVPDGLVLTSEVTQHVRYEGKNGKTKRYRYDCIEFVALWYNNQGHSANDLGVMIEGAMAKEEVRWGFAVPAWTWAPRKVDNHPVEPQRIHVKNKYIQLALVKHIQRLALPSLEFNYENQKITKISISSAKPDKVAKQKQYNGVRRLSNTNGTIRSIGSKTS